MVGSGNGGYLGHVPPPRVKEEREGRVREGEGWEEWSERGKEKERGKNEKKLILVLFMAYMYIPILVLLVKTVPIAGSIHFILL